MPTEFKPDYVLHPGYFVQESIQDLGYNQADLAERTDFSAKHINEIIKGKASITPDFAVALERVTGTPAHFWNNLELKYQEHVARIREGQELAGQENWIKQFPLAEMVNRGLIPAKSKSEVTLQDVLSFFNVVKPEVYENIEKQYAPAYRQSAKRISDRPSVIVWLQQGENEGRREQVAPFDKAGFKASLSTIRTLTLLPEINKALLKAKEICASHGVVLAWIPEYPRTAVCGATQWLSPQKVLIQLSLRYKRHDSLWFSFFHEAGHVLKHNRTLFVDLLETADNELEMEANRFAADTLILPADYARFVAAGKFTNYTVKQFADRIGIHPGIIVGRLQNDEHISRAYLNELKLPLKWGQE